MTQPPKTAPRLLILISLMLPLFVLGAWCANLIYTKISAPLFEVEIEGFDPRDLLYGRYIEFNYKWETLTPQTTQIPPTTTGRYYLPETDAPILDTVFRQNEQKFSVTLKFFNNSPQIQQLLIDDQPWQEWLAQNAKNHDNTQHEQ